METQKVDTRDVQQEKPTHSNNNKVAKNVVIMGLVSFFNDLSSELVYPLIPIFLTTILGAPVAILGLIEGIAESTGSIFKLLFGWVSDKLQKRKPIVVLGYFLSACSKLMLGLAYVWPWVLGARFADRLGKGIRTSARDAFIAESSSAENRGLSFGLHRAMDTMGAVLGPLLAIVFITTLHNNFHLVFYLAAIPGFIGVLILWVMVKEKPKPPLPLATSLLGAKNLSFSFKIFILISCVFAIGNSSDAFLILRAQNLGFSTVQVILVYAAFNVAYALFSTPAGFVSDRIGKKKVLLFGFFLFALVYLLFGFIQNKSLLWLIFPIYGVFMALTDGVGKAYIAEFVPHENLGVAYGIYQTTTGVCTLFSSIIAGLLWTYVSVPAPFVFGGVMALIASILFLLI